MNSLKHELKNSVRDISRCREHGRNQRPKFSADTLKQASLEI